MKMTRPIGKCTLRTDALASSQLVGVNIAAHDLYPIVTSSDGNCLYNATSILLVGHEYLSIALRVSTAMELVLNDGYYKDNFRQNSDLTGVSYDDAVADVIHPYRESSM